MPIDIWVQSVNNVARFAFDSFGMLVKYVSVKKGNTNF